VTDYPQAKDLVILAADGQIEFAVKGLLTRNLSIGFREISFDIFVHPEKDPGCLLRCHDFLRPFYRQYAHALVMFDRVGCGKEAFPRESLELEVEKRLSKSGWGDRSAVIVLDPELESWVWSDSPEVAPVLGWADKSPPLSLWLQQNGYLGVHQQKPERPKKAMEEALRFAKKGRSSSIYLELAKRVGVNRCVDPAFTKFKLLMKQWFGLNKI